MVEAARQADVGPVPPSTPLDKSTWDSVKDRLPNTLFAKNRARLFQKFKEQIQVTDANKAVALFKGASEVPLYSSDVNYPTYQEAFFYYVFGVIEMDCYGLVDFNTEKAILFVPKLDNLYKIWMTVMTKEDYAAKYEVEVRYIDELAEYLQTKCAQDTTVYVNRGVNCDSGLTTQIPEASYLADLTVDYDQLHDIICEARTVKNDEEILAMRWSAQIAAESHCNVLRNCEPGMRESQLESFFVYRGQQDYYIGRVEPYLSICGCGPTAATLHYQDNNKTLIDGQTMLTDQGHSFHHYCSDVTISFPVNGKFTQKQAEIYNLVLKANRAVFAELKPGSDWIEMHKLAERTILAGLLELGLLQNATVDELMEKRIGFLFMPHGLGHFLGLDTHDVGGYLAHTPKRQQLPGLRNVRTARIMEVHNVITIEPGCYFRDFLLDGDVPADFYQFDLSYLNREKIREYQAEVCGVRIEDNVLITEDGCENMSYDVPRTVPQIEACMANQEWRGL